MDPREFKARLVYRASLGTARDSFTQKTLSQKRITTTQERKLVHGFGGTAHSSGDVMAVRVL